MRYRICWSNQAIESLESIKAYIARFSPAKAEKVVSDLVIYARQLERFPLLGVTDKRFGDDSLRKLIQDEYFLVYRLQDNRIEILDAFSSKQDFLARFLRDK
ncbi:type II toxin-antitoxin system RelE/ParE family toxin [Desulfoscipio sp. XC116]|uniref:type II toxin-antitoxin system RelE/ParE family toxin n=1 Tax=Desulfoscipio sp. XC116 TaxID=3144975 RepID=UPI00325C126C